MSRKKINIMQNISQILNLIKELKGFKKDIELAKFFGVGASTISTWKKRGTIPYQELFSICEEEDWDYQKILTGEQKKTIYKMDDKDVEVVRERRSPYLKHEKNVLLNMASQILNSNINHSVTFASNIRHFYKAIKKDELLSVHKHKHIEYEKRFAELEKKLFRAVSGNTKVGSGNPTHIGDATRKKGT